MDITLKVTLAKGGALRAVEVVDPPWASSEPAQDDITSTVKLRFGSSGKPIGFEAVELERHQGPLVTPGQTRIPDPPMEPDPEGRLFAAPKEVDDNTAKAGREWRRRLVEELQGDEFAVAKWQPENDTIKRLLEGFENPLLVERQHTYLVVPVASSELNATRPGAGWALNKNRVEALRAAAGLAHLPLVFAFSDGQAAIAQDVWQAARDGHGGDGNFYLVPRGVFPPRQEVLS